MPFLRAVGSASAAQAAVEIRSAKTLIGSGETTCDVVLPPDRSVLELHALLNLSNDHASATLVPFSTTSDGACFLNGRVVPRDGAMVVHGDRVAFGNADNAFVFSLTDTGRVPPVQPPPAVDAASLQNSRSFRRALDALRGDRAPMGPVASLASPSAAPNRLRMTATSSLSTSASRARLETFLNDTSSDSLLGDFVERKLRSSSSTSASASRRLRAQPHRPTAMEPPPSLSGSTVSSLRSSLNDSILDRTAHRRERILTPATETDGLLTTSQSLLSTAERNYAEIEKLRLSQRLREVNNVLNGHLHFGSSYLSPERRSSGGSASMRYASPRKPVQPLSVRDDPDDDEAEDAHDSVDELPTLVERPKRNVGVSSTLPVAQAILSQPTQPTATRGRSVQSSIASLFGKSLQDQSVVAHEDSLGNDEDVDVPVDESLPSFSEAILRQRGREESVTADAATPPRLPTSLASKSVTTVAPVDEPAHRPKVRPQLHQQLIDRTLRRKRHEILTDAFHRWRRGLRVQQQRQRENAKQLVLVDRKLQLLRRNHSFDRWKRWTERKHQVLECREESFAQRQQLRSVRQLWGQWIVATLWFKQSRRVLRKVVTGIESRQLRSGFQQWKRSTDVMESIRRERDLVVNHHASLERRLDAMARNHHRTRGHVSSLQRIVRAWHRVARLPSMRTRVLHRVLAWRSRRYQLRAWTTWKQNTALGRQAEQIDQQRQADIAHTSAAASQQLEIREQELRDQYDKQLNDLRATMEEQQRALRTIENEKQATKKRLADAKSAAKMQWQTALEALLKHTIAAADTQITHVSTQLEAFLQHMDVEPAAARYQAASFLVESMLEQKLRDANERVQAQDELVQAIKGWNDEKAHEALPADVKPAAAMWRSALTNNARFLLEMMQQRHARLHQLYQAVAKLAATVVETTAASHSRRPGSVRVDTAKLQHAAFLTDAMHDRALQHLDAVLAIHYRRCTAGTATTDATREARKY